MQNSKIDNSIIIFKSDKYENNNIKTIKTNNVNIF